MNKSVLKNFAIRTRQYLLETAVSYGMDEMQAQETAYLCFMQSVMQCYLEENSLPVSVSQILPDWKIPEYFVDIQVKIINLLKQEMMHDDWLSHVQIIGWMHQYYHTEMKDAVFLRKKRTSRISEQEIAVTTQFFTPKWLSKYLVENSLGRLWNDSHENQKLTGLHYVLAEPEQSDVVQKKLNSVRKQYQNISPEEITFFDPCMGTGHILIQAFEIFMQMYQNSGYDNQTAVKFILQKNLWGLELEQHACDVAKFIVLMKALTYDRQFLDNKIQPNFACFRNAGVPELYGSLCKKTGVTDIDRILLQNYDVVVTNPPYMGRSGMPERLSEFVRQNFPASKHDLYACFIERCSKFTRTGGYCAMLTMHGWMFLSSFTNLREKLFQEHIIINLLHLGAYGFELADVGTIVQTAGFVMQKIPLPAYTGNYFNLCMIHDAEEKHKAFLKQQGERYAVTQKNFSQIPGCPAVYWASEQIFKLFHAKKLGDFAEPKQGITTSNNHRFVRQWHEVNYHKICFHAKNHEQAMQSHLKWFPYQKGGGYRKWYGNHIYVINYEHNGQELLAFHEELNKFHAGGRLKNKEYYFKKSITWTFIATTSGFRIGEEGFLFDVAGSSLFTQTDRQRHAMLGFLCSRIAEYLLYLLNPTMNIQAHDVKALPYLEHDSDRIQELVQENIAICKQDWDSFETSWDFKRHPLI